MVDANAERDAERVGAHPSLIPPEARVRPRTRAALLEDDEDDEASDPRWRLLDAFSDSSSDSSSDPAGDAASSLTWTWPEAMGDVGGANSARHAQFLAATDSDPRTIAAVAAAARAFGGGAAGVLPGGGVVAFGGPEAAAAARDVANVAWVGPLTPEDVTSSAWDSALEALGEVFGGGAGTNDTSQNTNQSGAANTTRAELAALGVLRRSGFLVDEGDGRAFVEVWLPSLHARGAVVGAGAEVPVSAALASAFAAEVEAAARGAGDAGARATALDASDGRRKTLLAVKPEALLAAVPRLAARRAAHWVAPKMRAEGLGRAFPRGGGGPIRGERAPGGERASKPKRRALRGVNERTFVREGEAAGDATGAGGTATGPAKKRFARNASTVRRLDARFHSRRREKAAGSTEGGVSVSDERAARDLAAVRAHDIPKSPARITIASHADGAVVIRRRRPRRGERQRAGDGRLLRERVEALVEARHGPQQQRPVRQRIHVVRRVRQ